MRIVDVSKKPVFYFRGVEQPVMFGKGPLVSKQLLNPAYPEQVETIPLAMKAARKEALDKVYGVNETGQPMRGKDIILALMAHEDTWQREQEERYNTEMIRFKKDQDHFQGISHQWLQPLYRRFHLSPTPPDTSILKPSHYHMPLIASSYVQFSKDTNPVWDWYLPWKELGFIATEERTTGSFSPFGRLSSTARSSV